jgi:hypothetical protein
MSAEKERAAVVAWLNKEANEYRIEGNNVTIGFAIAQAAREIERGDHLPTDRQALRDDITARYENTLRYLEDER